MLRAAGPQMADAAQPATYELFHRRKKYSKYGPRVTTAPSCRSRPTHNPHLPQKPTAVRFGHPRPRAGEVQSPVSGMRLYDSNPKYKKPQVRIRELRGVINRHWRCCCCC